jgi:cell division protein FtsB
MTLLRELRRRVRQAIPQAIAACMVAYFAYHAVQGERGLLAHQRLSQDVARAEQVAADIAARRLALEERVALLRPEGLDPDMLEERARFLLNYGYAEDKVIFLPEADRNSPKK